tara:strand:- start:2935 stop:4113 length:1179 start_codon:yes stop_codon:yes gene_type:complete
MTKIENLKVLIISFILISLTFIVQAKDLKIAYLDLTDDPRYDENLIYARIQLKPTGRPLIAVKIAEEESKMMGDALGINFILENFSFDNIDNLNNFINKNDENFIYIVDLSTADLKNLNQNISKEEVIIFNVSSNDNLLRNENCNKKIFHTIPSYNMLTDSLGQFLIKKNWKKVILLKGPHEEDIQFAQSFKNSSNKMGIQIVEEKDFILSNDPREREQNNIALLSGDKKHDVIFLSDTEGEFGRYVPYNTKLPRPIIGTTGLTPETWHWSFERHGAPQLNSRFEKKETNRRMSGYDYAAWISFKSIVKAVKNTRSILYEDIVKALTDKNLRLDGFKGGSLSFREWNNQLRQPILLSTHNALIEKTPIKGFLHEINDMDTLGKDLKETKCKF